MKKRSMKIPLLFWQMSVFCLCCETIKAALKNTSLIYRKSRPLLDLFFWKRQYLPKRELIRYRGCFYPWRDLIAQFATRYLGIFFIDSFSLLSLICLNRFHSKQRVCTNWYKARVFAGIFIHISDIYLIRFH